jgi:HicA toxin of bacterial toxin-antitoxin,
MSKKEKLLKRFLARPRDFTFDELEALLRIFGFSRYEGGRTSGSRIRFVHPLHPPISLHRPHPGNTLKRYQMEQIETFLRAEGLIVEHERPDEI